MKALYDYEARRPEELSITQGELIVVTNKDFSGWWDAELKGKKGVIPGNYVQDYTPSTAPPLIAAPQPKPKPKLNPNPTLPLNYPSQQHG